jgi:hypothetical protein
MADKDLFNGHKYIFTKVSSSLVMEDSTDNSHEKITFREGLISSGSITSIEPIEITVPGTSTYALQVNNYASSYSNGDKGIKIRCGDDWSYYSNNQYNYLIDFYAGNNISLGSISAYGYTVAYNTFTGEHKAVLLQSDSTSADKIADTGSIDNSLYHIYPEGTILSVVKSELIGKDVQPIEYCVTSSTYQDKRVFGVYMYSRVRDEGEDDYHAAWSIGDGIILVCSQNGNIENGDYITTASGSGGYGCKQNSEFLANYTVAKSLEDVDWSTEPSSSKLIACTYHCG